MKELKTLLSINLCLAILLNCISPAAFASQVPDEAVPSGVVSEVGEQTEEESDVLSEEETPAVIASGYCGGEGDGTNLTWELTEDGTLTISGEGAMADWALNTLPWASYCHSIRVVNVLEGVTSIGNQSFYNCSAITQISLPKSLNAIGNSAFYNCASLTGVSLPENLTAIGDYAFCGCSKIESISIPDSVEELGIHAFNGCTSLITVVLSKNISYIGEFAFAGCSALISISIPEGITAIDSASFANCSGLAKIILPSSVAVIGDRAFADCSGLSEIRFKGDAPSINENAFESVFADVVFTAYYPAGNETWTEEVMQDYGGTITWESYSPVIDSGYCGGEGDGTNLTWELTEDGTLAISGTGAMANFSSYGAPWYSYRTNMKSVVIGDSVTSIGKDAFSKSHCLTAVDIPDSVTTIGDWAFFNCLGLTTVTIGKSVATIGQKVFSACYSLTSIEVDANNPSYSSDSFGVLFNKDKTVLVAAPGAIPDAYAIPNSVTTIGDDAFYGCSRLTTVSIPESVTTIGNNAFHGCSGLTTVTIPDSVTTIRGGAFSYCSNLAAIVVDVNNPNYSNDSFGILFNKDKTVLVAAPGAIKNYIVPDSVTTIGTSAFHFCDSLTEVTIPGSVTTFDSLAFCSCDSLTEIHFEGKAPSFGVSVFSGVTATAYYPAGNETWTDDIMQDYGGTITWVAVVASGHCGGEEDGTNLTWTLTEDGVLTISGEGAMADWNNPFDVPWYGHRYDIRSIIIGDSVTTIGGAAFHGCGFLPTVTIPESVTAIGNAAFHGCFSLTTVTIPASITSIGSAAFSFCSSLSAIIVDENNPNYSNDSFGVLFNKDKTVLVAAPGAITTYTIPDSVTSIGADAFEFCIFLTTVTIPESVTAIERGAFDSCDTLTSVTIPAAVTTIGDLAFSRCYELTAITVDENNPNYSSDSFGVLFNKDKSTLIQAPGAIEGVYAIPDSVTTIGTRAFFTCDILTGIIIPASVTNIGEYAFSDCESLVEIRFKGNTPAFGKDVFEYLTATAYYPAGNDTWTDDIMQDYGGTITWAAVVASAYCGGEGDGTNLTWTLTEDGTLTISGEGAMANWSWYSAVPWYNHCSSIKTVVVGDLVTTIGNYAFRNYDSLSTVTIGNSVTTIGIYAFYDCNALTTVYIGSGIRNIENQAFALCNNLTEVIIDQYELLVTNNGNIPETATVTYKEPDPTAVIQTWAVGANDETDATAILYSDGKLVISGKGAFRKANWPKSVVEVVIEDGITNVPDSAFSGFTNLVAVTLGSAVTAIGHAAFNNSGLTELVIPNSVDTIGNNAFSYCTNLKMVLLGKNLSSIGFYAFCGTDISEVSIPNSVRSIAFGAFSGCESLESVQIGRGLRSLDAEAFANCTNLTTIYWNAIKLSYYADSHYGYLGSSSEVFRAAGKDGEGITLTIGPDVEYLPSYLFYVSSSNADGAVNLKRIVNQSDRLVGIGSFAFYNCANLESVELSNSLQTIGESAFNSCSALEKITLPDTLTSIGRKAFFRTGLTEITIGNLVTDIGESAFAECSDEFVIRGFSGTYAETYALENDFTFVPLDAVLLTLHRNFGEDSSREIMLVLNAQVSLVGRGDVFLEELSTTVPGIRLVGWNTAADGTGTAYSVEDAVTMSENLVLYAQWEIPTALIGGQEIPINEDASAENWQYVWNADKRRATVTLTNYAGGSIVLPVDAVIYVYGETVIQSESGSAVTGTRIDIAVEENANLIIRSGQDAAAIQCTYLSIWGTGAVSISSDYAVAVDLALPLEYILNGKLEIVASEKALSNETVRVYNASDIYLAVDAEEPASKYDGGAYLRIQMKTWQLELNANGGTWADQEEETKTIEVGFWESISLSSFADLLRREGFILSGWSDEDKNTEYTTNGTVTSAANLILNAMWTERTLVIDGVTYDLDASHEGDGWSYVPAGEGALPLLTLTDYIGGRIYITSDLEIIASGDNTIKGPTGEPAIEVLGSLSLTATDGTTLIRGGTGAHGILADGSIWMINRAELSIKGGSGGTAIHSGKDVSLANDGVFTAEGGSLAPALYAENGLTLSEGSGKAFFISGSVEQAAICARGVSISNKLKFYGGNNASTARRSSVSLRYAYVKVQPKTITVKLNINGGTLSDGIELTQEYVQGADNSITLNSNLIPTRFGYSFVNWTTKQDGSGSVYVPGESYTFSDSTDELNLFAKWEELEYDIMINDQVVLRLKDEVPADAVVFFVVYSANGQMKDLVTGTCGDDGLWYFPNIETQEDDVVKIFFMDDDAYAPLRGEIVPNL